MKFGCCVNMLPGVKHLAGAKYFDTMAELGYDYVEIPLNMLSQLSDDEVKQVRAALRSMGYDGGMSLEARPSSEEAWKHEAALSLAELHRIFD